MSQGGITCPRRATAMEEGKRSEFSLQSDHDLRLVYYLESFTGSAYTISNSNSDGYSIAEPYEPEVEHPLCSPPGESDDDEWLHNSKLGKQKASIILVVNLELSLA